MPWQTGFHRDSSGRLTTNSSGTGKNHGVARLDDGSLRFTLSAPTKMQNGFPVDNNGNIAVTSNLTGAKWSGGFLRAPNGALVVGVTPSKWESGYLRGPNGELVVTATA